MKIQSADVTKAKPAKHYESEIALNDSLCDFKLVTIRQILYYFSQPSAGIIANNPVSAEIVFYFLLPLASP